MDKTCIYQKSHRLFVERTSAMLTCSPCLVFRLVTESGAVLGGRPDLLHHSAGTVLGGYGGICRGEVSLTALPH